MKTALPQSEIDASCFHAIAYADFPAAHEREVQRNVVPALPNHCTSAAELHVAADYLAKNRQTMLRIQCDEIVPIRTIVVPRFASCIVSAPHDVAVASIHGSFLLHSVAPSSLEVLPSERTEKVPYWGDTPTHRLLRPRLPKMLRVERPTHRRADSHRQNTRLLD